MEVDYGAPVFPSVEFMAECLKNMYYVAKADESVHTVDGQARNAFDLAKGYVFVSYFDLLLEPTSDIMAEYRKYMKEQKQPPFATNERQFKYLQIARMTYYTRAIVNLLRTEYNLSGTALARGACPASATMEWVDKAETIHRVIPQWLKIKEMRGRVIDLNE